MDGDGSASTSPATVPRSASSALQFTGGSSGITCWTLSGAADGASARGQHRRPADTNRCATRRAAAPRRSTRLGASRIDHVVITTSSLERTCGAIESATGEPLKRVREAGPGVRQGFHRFGEVIIEVVERADLPPDAATSFWGLVLVVEGDLFEACAELGPDVIGLSSPGGSARPAHRHGPPGARSRPAGRVDDALSGELPRPRR